MKRAMLALTTCAVLSTASAGRYTDDEAMEAPTTRPSGEVRTRPSPSPRIPLVVEPFSIPRGGITPPPLVVEPFSVPRTGGIQPARPPREAEQRDGRRGRHEENQRLDHHRHPRRRLSY